MSQKTIDVIIPVYNGIPYVQRTLMAVINQTLKPTQIIIVNDGSTDNTLFELEKIKSQHPEANINIISKPNGGHSSATNVGIRASTAEFIALVDADDLWHATKLEKQMKVFEASSDPKLGVVYNNYLFINANDVELPDFPCSKLDPDFKGDVFKHLVVKGNYITGSNSAVLVKRSVFLDHGFFDENLRCGEDWDMWLRIAQTYTYDYSPEVLTYIRTHGNNLSNQNMLHCRSDIYIIHKWRKQFIQIGGIPLIVEYISRTTVKNLKTLATNKEFAYLLNQIQEITNFKMPRLILFWALLRKIKKRCLA